jgi:hypothetical protein
MGSRKREAYTELEHMMGDETYADMYERLEKELGGEPFMPSYAYEARDEQVKNLEDLRKKGYREVGGTKEEFRNKLDKKLKRAKKYAEGGLVKGKRKIAKGCGKVMGNRRKKTLYT